LGRLGEAEDVAQAILSVHGMAWVTGQVLECDGGLSLYSPIDPTGVTRASHDATPARPVRNAATD
jgi:hypothetical protein